MRVDGVEPHLSHVPSDVFVIDMQPLPVQDGGDPPSTVKGVFRKNLVDVALQPQIFSRGRTGLVVKAGPVQPRQIRLGSQRQGTVLSSVQEGNPFTPWERCNPIFFQPFELHSESPDLGVEIFDEAVLFVLHLPSGVLKNLGQVRKGLLPPLREKSRMHLIDGSQFTEALLLFK